MTIHQLFCCVDDLLSDVEKPGADTARLLQAIRDASDVLQKEIGWFIPVRQTTQLRGSGKRSLIVQPPILSLTGSVTNDGAVLVEGTHFLLTSPNWANGPAAGLEMLSTYGSAWCDRDVNSVQIPCVAGLYEQLAAIGATVQDATQQDASQETLKVSNGGKISLGMTLLIGTEQELVTGWSDPTNNVTALNGEISNSDDVITVDDGSLLFPNEVMRADFEDMRIKSIREDRVHVERAFNGTDRVAHDDNTEIDVYRTVNVERGINGTDVAVHANGAAISRYLAPADISFLTKQIAILMINKARGNYAGKSGNAETGEVFYHDAFPRYEIERVKQNYLLGKI